MGVTTGDFDNDGDIDFAVADTNHLRFYWNDGSGTFVDGPVVSVSGITRIVAADVTLDGTLDIIALDQTDVKIFSILAGIPTLQQTIVHGVTPDILEPIKPSAGDVVTLKVSETVGGTLFHFVLGDIPRNNVGFPLPSLTNYTNALEVFNLIAAGSFGVPGEGTLDISFNVPVGLSGIAYFHQIYAYDPGAANSYTQSSGLAIRYQ